MRGSASISSVLVCVALVAACQSPPNANEEGLQPRRVRELESWQVSHGGALVGSMRLLEIEDPREAIRFYRIENPAGQWLGYIDDSGRVYRYLPFAREEEFCGIYTMERGVAKLFGVDAGIQFDGTSNPAEASLNSTDK